MCLAACMYVVSCTGLHLCHPPVSALCCSYESDQASFPSTGPSPLIKNANVSRRDFDVGPRHTKPAKVTKGLCNPLFGARRREKPS